MKSNNNYWLISAAILFTKYYGNCNLFRDIRCNDCIISSDSMRTRCVSTCTVLSMVLTTIKVEKTAINWKYSIPRACAGQHYKQAWTSNPFSRELAPGLSYLTPVTERLVENGTISMSQILSFYNSINSQQKTNFLSSTKKLEAVGKGKNGKLKSTPNSVLGPFLVLL